MNNAPIAIDLFCGAGGFSRGLEDAGFDVLWGIDHNSEAVTTYRENHSATALKRDIRSVDPVDGISVDPKDDNLASDEIDQFDIEPAKLDLIVGGPPCPTFSTLGRSKISSLTDTTPETDDRNDLYEEFLRFVSLYEPKVFVMENVPGIVSAENDQGEQVEEIISDEMESLGYSVTVSVVDAAKYGVPQHRKRAFFIGNRIDSENPDLTAWKTHREPVRNKEKNMKLLRETWDSHTRTQLTMAEFGAKVGSDSAPTGPESQKDPYITVADAILDLPPVSPDGDMPPTKATAYTLPPLTEYQQWARDTTQNDEECTLHNHESRGHNLYDLSLYKLLGEGVGWNIGKVDQTLQPYRTDIFGDKYKKQNPREPASTILAHLAKDGHMFIHPREARSITVREAARLQSFKDSFVFPVSRTDAFRLVGNAVPPRLGKSIGQAIKTELLEAQSS